MAALTVAGVAIGREVTEPATPCPVEVAGKPATDFDLEDEPAPYAGAGPHPLVVSDIEGDEDDAEVTFDADWLGKAAAPWNKSPGQRIQLVVCHYVYDVSFVGAEYCTYHPRMGGTPVQVPLRTAKHRYRVFEAATGKEAGAFDAEMSTECPDEIWVSTTQYDKKLTADAVESDVIEKLRPYAEAPR